MEPSRVMSAADGPTLSPARSPPRTPPRSAPPVGSTVAVLVGLALALSVMTVTDALLVPALDRAPPRAVGRAAAGLTLAVGWLWAARRAVPLTSRGSFVLTVSATGGAFLASALLEPLATLLDDSLRAGTALGYYPTVFAIAALLQLPILAPLGALAALVLDTPRRRPWVFACLGIGAGVLLAPYLGEVLLGRRATLQTCAVVAGAVGWLVTESAPHVPSRRGTSAGQLVGLVVVGIGVALTWRLADVMTDRGSVGLPLFTSLIAIGAALGVLVVPRRWALAAIAFWSWILSSLLPDHPRVLPYGGTPLLDDVVLLALLAGPWGLAVGALLRPDDEQRSSAWTGGLVPVALTLFVPAVLLVGLPAATPHALLAGAGFLAFIAAGRTIPTWTVLVFGLTLFIAPLTVDTTRVGAEATSVQHLPDVTVATFRDDIAGREQLAVMGRAPLGRSALQERRFVHVPMLLHGGGHVRVLLIGSTTGEELHAARMHDVLPADATFHQPPFLWWLSPVRFPDGWRPGPVDAPEVFLEFGSERQFLLQHADAYDVIIMSPDPRVRRRAHLVGTRSFYALCRSRLAEDGMFCQWWDLAAIDVTDVKSAIASMHAEFPHVTLVHDHPRTRHGVIGLIGTEEPLTVDPRAIDAWIAGHPDVARDMIAVDLDGLAIACLPSADRAMLELLAPPEDAVSDDRPVIGVRAGWRTLHQPATLSLGMRAWTARRRDPRENLSLPGVDTEEAARFDAVARDMHRAWAHLFGHAMEIVNTYGTTVRPFESEAPGELPPEEIEGFQQALSILPEWPLLTRELVAYARRLEDAGEVDAADRVLRVSIASDELNADLRVAAAELAERRGDLADARVLFGSALECDADNDAARAGLERVGGTWPPDDEQDG